jgi:hypothetical protein
MLIRKTEKCRHFNDKMWTIFLLLSKKQVYKPRYLRHFTRYINYSRKALQLSQITFVVFSNRHIFITRKSLTLSFSPPQALANTAPCSQCNPIDGKVRNRSAGGCRFVSLLPVGKLARRRCVVLLCRGGVFGSSERVVKYTARCCVHAHWKARINSELLRVLLRQHKFREFMW